MNRTVLPIVILSSTFALSVGCGSAEQNYRKVAQSSLDAVPVQPVEFSFTLPSRSNLGLDASLLREKMTGFAWRIEGQGDKCKDTKPHESFGPYEDARTYIMELSATCSYAVKVMVGELAGNAAAGSGASLAATINYKDNIKPVIQQQCVSCHADYQDFSVVAKNASAIVSHVENETMPPDAPLDGSLIALFLAWGDDGFQESNPNPAPITPSDTALSEVFYRNNLNDVLHSHELLGRTNYELRRTLWIQPAGEALDLNTREIYTYRVTSP